MKRNHPKGDDLAPWRYLLSIAAFIGALVVSAVALASGGGGLEGLARFFVLTAAAATLIDLIRKRERIRIRSVAVTFLGYIWSIFSEVLLIALMLPMLALIFITGPAMAFLCLISMFLSGVYFIVKVLGIPIRGIVVVYGPLTALVAAVIAVVAGYIFFKCMDMQDRWFDWWRERVTALFRLINRHKRDSSGS